MSRITDERLKELRDRVLCAARTRPLPEVISALDELIARRAAMRFDAAGNVKLEASLLEREAIGALNAVKAWLDCDGNDGFPAEVRMRIDALLMMAEQRRTGITAAPGAEAAAPEMFNGLTEEQTAATASVAGLSAQPEAPAVPAGWKLVPEVATAKMCRAGDTNQHGYSSELGAAYIGYIYHSMLEAAPEYLK